MAIKMNVKLRAQKPPKKLKKTFQLKKLWTSQSSLFIVFLPPIKKKLWDFERLAVPLISLSFLNEQIEHLYTLLLTC